MMDEESKSHSHRHRHRHHRYRSDRHSSQSSTRIEDPGTTIIAEKVTSDVNQRQDDATSKESLETRIMKCKRILLDFRKGSQDVFDDMKTQLNILHNGYSVDLSKVTQSLLQGTLQVVFTLLSLPINNRGYFWDEEDFDEMQVFDIFGDCCIEDTADTEARVTAYFDTIKTTVSGDNNAIDLDLEEEKEGEEGPIGPSLPPPSVMTTSMITSQGVSEGPIIPQQILELMKRGIPVQIEKEEDEDIVGPALPGQEIRMPTLETLEQLAQAEEDEKNRGKPQKRTRSEWMTMMPEAGFSSAFAEVKPRRFANIPEGCTFDPSWAETPEERKRKMRDHLAKTSIGGVEEEKSLTKEEETQKQLQLREFFEQYDQEHRPESLASIHKRLKAQNQTTKSIDSYSRETLFSKATPRKNQRNFAGDSSNHMGNLKSRFGQAKYSGGSMF